ncbi:hypothetical protein J2S22_005115 [Rhodoplanes tepidamans]|nr:hypothetical protein [Rhodoplanes tepidamans]
MRSDTHAIVALEKENAALMKIVKQTTRDIERLRKELTSL